MSEKSDASTTTDDIKIPPLCLFYFSHPFGILSPDPPTVTPAPEGCYPSSWMPSFSGGRVWQQPEVRVPPVYQMPPPTFQFHAPDPPNKSDTKGYSSANKRSHCQHNTYKRNKSQYTDTSRMGCRYDIFNKSTNTEKDAIEMSSSFAQGNDGCSKCDETYHERVQIHENFNRNYRSATCCGGQKYNYDARFVPGRREGPRVSARKMGKSFQKQNHYHQTLPPIELPIKPCAEEHNEEVKPNLLNPNWPFVDQANNFRTKAHLPPIEIPEQFQNIPELLAAAASANNETNNIPDENERLKSQVEVNDSDITCKEIKKRTRQRKRPKVRSIQSSSRISKARRQPNKSATRKLVNFILQSVPSGRRAPNTSLLPLTEVLNIVREAWTSPKTLLQNSLSGPPEPPEVLDPDPVMLAPRERTSARAGASPGLLRRRYSVPETVMRKYKLAQQKSDSEESEVGSAPSPPRGYSPARKLGGAGTRVPSVGARPSPLLRRLWGRQGGSHSELRYWDSCSGSSDMHNTCEACKRLSDKNIPTAVKAEGLPPSPVHKAYRISRSPKKLNPYCSQGFSPERYITHLENARDLMLRESKSQITSPSLFLTSGSAPSDRSSYKSITVSDGSPKLGLSSLATSSYPITDGNSVSDVTSEMTRSSASYSSDDVAQTRCRATMNRPVTAEYPARNDSRINSENPKKRRQSLCIYMNSFDSPNIEIKSTSVTGSNASASQDSSNKETSVDTYPTSETNTPRNWETGDSTKSKETDVLESSTTKSVTTTSDTTTETSNTTSTAHRETSSPSDSAVSTRASSVTTSVHKSLETCDSNDVKTPRSQENEQKDHEYQNRNNNNIMDLSDTGFSENIINENDSNRNSFKSSNSDQIISQSESVSQSEDISVETTYEVNVNSPPKIPISSLKNIKLECLEVIVSETVNSNAFSEQNRFILNHTKDINDNSSRAKSELSKKHKENLIRQMCTPGEIDHYVSNILIDSLNSMTDQINEINSHTDDDMKLNILEKEIKVKLQNICASPINLPTNTIISSLVTKMPDKDLLETTVIEEQSQSYTTETNLFPREQSSENYPENQNENVQNPVENSKVNSQNEESLSLVQDSLLQLPCDPESINNNYKIDSFQNEIDNDDEGRHFYLNDTTDMNENHEIPGNYETSNGVLQKLNKMFENNSQSVDSNFNICLDSTTNNYFCGSVYRDISHLEMSTDVDVFVDNSLTKMMNSIDLCSNIEDLSNENDQSITANTSKETNTKNSKDFFLDESHNYTSDFQQSEVNTSKNIISNIGSGSLYQKPQQMPIVVPRFSAIPHSESMEVNTSSDEDGTSCESDCLSLVDSLDDPNSPRFLDHKNRNKINKCIKKNTSSDIMTMLPENTTFHREYVPKEKSETFFVPIKDDTLECNTENVVVAEHMPEKIKERLAKRQQKRELRKEHYKKKKLKLLKKESEKQKETENKKVRETHEKECVDILNGLVEQVVDKIRKDDRTKIDHNVRSALHKTANDGNKSNLRNKKVLQRNERIIKKDERLQDFESFVIDKKGDIQINSGKKDSGKRDYFKNSSKKSKSHNDIFSQNVEINRFQNKYDIQEPRYNPNLSGPRRLYQKTEFKEGNKHVEILEIVECVDSSPEPLSDECQNFNSDFKLHNKSKIPVPVTEKTYKNSKRKLLQKLPKRCKSPMGRSVPFNITAAKNDQGYVKMNNSKVDQLIANILIDAFNEDNPDNRRIHVITSPHANKPIHPVVKKLSSSGQSISPRKNNIQQNSEKLSIVPKYKQKFDVIPEERSSLSIESSNEDVSKLNKRFALPIDMKLQEDNANVTSYTEDSTIRNGTKNYHSSETSQLETIMENGNKIVDNSTNDAEVQSDIIRRNVQNHDVATSPIPQFVSAATSPIPLDIYDQNKNNKVESKNRQIKGKKALGTKEGWAGFCRPQTEYSPEKEGSPPSSNNPSGREVIEKISRESQEYKIAPPSQRVLRTMDSKNNIRQISISHKPPAAEKHSTPQSECESELKETNREKHSNKSQRIKTSPPKKISARSLDTEKNNNNSFLGRKKHSVDLFSDSENQTDVSKAARHKINKVQVEIQKNEHKEGDENKKIMLSSPYRHQSLSQSSDTSSGSDSEVTVTCPALVPRWLPPSSLRYRRTVNRRNQRRDEPFQMPYQNVAGGWSVTLAGSCYTTIPSDVEMKVVFPKNKQQATSQSDSGLGEEHNHRKPSSGTNCCKKCGTGDATCKNCSGQQNCKCLSGVKRQDNMEKDKESFLLPTLGRRSNKSTPLTHSESLEQINMLTKKYNYLPEVNIKKNRTKKNSSIQMGRRFSLHCWLPEDRPSGSQKVAKMQISQSMDVGNDGEELSVLGCAILPGAKPRVPTMSERDLTRMHAAHFYARARRY